MSTFRDSSKSRRQLVGAILASGLALAACGTSKEDAASTTTAAAPAVTDAPTTVAPVAATEPTSEDTTAAETTVPSTGEFQAISGVPGVSDTEINFTVLGTGPANPLGGCGMDCFARGINAYFEFRNSQGGVNGRKLTFDVVDDELGNNQVKALEVIQGKKAFGVFDKALLASGFADLAAAGVPVYAHEPAAPSAAGFDSIFVANGVYCITCALPLYAYPAKLVGATKVGVLGYGISQASKDCVAAISNSYKKYDVGATVVYSNDNLEYGMPNGVAPEVTAMKDAGVDLVQVCVDINATATMEQEMERQGMGSVPVVLNGGAGDPAFLGQYGSLFEGDLVGFNNRPYLADTEGTQMADFFEWIKRTAAADTDLDQALQGWMNADMAYQGILAAGPDFDQAKVIAAMNAFEDYTAGGILPPVDFGRQHVAPTEADPVTNGPDPLCQTFEKIVGGKFEMVGDPAKPFLCWDPRAFGSYVDPTPTDFK